MKLDTIIKNISYAVYAVTAYLGLRLLQVLVALITYLGDVSGKIDGLVVVDDILTVLLYIVLTCTFIIPFLLMKQRNEKFLLIFQSSICGAAVLYLITFILDLMSGFVVSSIFGLFRECVFFAASFYLITLFVSTSGAIKMYFGSDVYINHAFFKINNHNKQSQGVPQQSGVQQTATQMQPSVVQGAPLQAAPQNPQQVMQQPQVQQQSVPQQIQPVNQAPQVPQAVAPVPQQSQPTAQVPQAAQPPSTPSQPPIVQ